MNVLLKQNSQFISLMYGVVTAKAIHRQLCNSKLFIQMNVRMVENKIKEKTRNQKNK